MTITASGETEYRDQAGKTYRVPITGYQNYYLVHRTGDVAITDADLPPFDFRELAPTR